MKIRYWIIKYYFLIVFCSLLCSCIYDGFLSKYGEEWMAEQTGGASSHSTGSTTTTTSIANISDNDDSSSSDDTTTTTIQNGDETTTTTSSTTTTSTTTTTTTTTIHVIAVGDVYYYDGTFEAFNTTTLNRKIPIGVVFSTDGVHGKMVHIKSGSGVWCKSSTEGYNMEFNTSLTDGSGNWQVICDAVTDEETTGNYGAFNYVNGLGDDWYLPAKDELEELICTKYDTVNAVLNSLVNHNSGNYSADRIYQDYHWSSSTYGKGVWKIYSGKNGKQILDTSSKAFSAYIRAIKKF